MSEIKWGYAMNQWNRIVRRNQQERAFKVLSVCGFRGVELEIDSGRYAALGRPEITELNYGSVKSFADILKSWGIDQVVSYFYDPERPSIEEGSPGRCSSNPSDHEGIVESARTFAEFLNGVKGSCLVVKAMGSYWKEAPVTQDKIRNAAECWNKVGKMTGEYGINTSMHIDFLSSLHSMDDVDKMMKFTDPELVSLTIDTAEMTIAGIDPVELYEKYHDRVNHFHFKDTHKVDKYDEYREENAEIHLLDGGGKQGVERWFWEMGTPEGLVDFPSLIKSMKKHDYKGWVIVESDQTPNPAESTMLNNWYIKKVLSNIMYNS